MSEFDYDKCVIVSHSEEQIMNAKVYDREYWLNVEFPPMTDAEKAQNQKDIECWEEFDRKRKEAS